METSLAALTQEIWRTLIQEWLMVTDLCQLDTALCSKTFRSHCLPYKLPHDGCWLLSGYLELLISCEAAKWLRERQLGLTTLYINGFFIKSWNLSEFNVWDDVETLICDNFVDHGSIGMMSVCFIFCPYRKLVIRKFRLIKRYFFPLLDELKNKPLTSLEISSCSDFDDSVLKLIGHQCTKLQHICFRDSPIITSVGLLEVLRSNPDIQTIDISDCRLVDDSVLGHIVTYSLSVRDLNVSGCFLVTTPAILNLISSCRQLQRLNVKGCYRVDQTQVREAMKHAVVVDNDSRVTIQHALIDTEQSMNTLCALVRRLLSSVDFRLIRTLALGILWSWQLSAMIQDGEYNTIRLIRQYKSIAIGFGVTVLLYFRHSLWWAWQNPKMVWLRIRRVTKQYVRAGFWIEDPGHMFFWMNVALLAVLAFVPVWDALQWFVSAGSAVVV